MPAIDPDASADPLTEAEQRRVDALLASVSTQTLLRSLARLCRDNVDTRLIVAALLRRAPADDAASGDEPTDHAPVMPI